MGQNTLETEQLTELEVSVLAVLINYYNPDFSPAELKIDQFAPSKDRFKQRMRKEAKKLKEDKSFTMENGWLLPTEINKIGKSRSIYKSGIHNLSNVLRRLKNMKLIEQHQISTKKSRWRVIRSKGVLKRLFKIFYEYNYINSFLRSTYYEQTPFKMQLASDFDKALGGKFHFKSYYGEKFIFMAPELYYFYLRDQKRFKEAVATFFKFVRENAPDISLDSMQLLLVSSILTLNIFNSVYEGRDIDSYAKSYKLCMRKFRENTHFEKTLTNDIEDYFKKHKKEAKK